MFKYSAPFSFITVDMRGVFLDRGETAEVERTTLNGNLKQMETIFSSDKIKSTYSTRSSSLS